MRFRKTGTFTSGMLSLPIVCGSFLHLVVTVSVVEAETHDDRVQQKISKYLDESFRKSGSIIIRDRVSMAFTAAKDTRKLPGNSQNPVFRDAEYYLMGLTAGLGEDVFDKIVMFGIPFMSLERPAHWCLRILVLSGQKKI